MNRKSRFWDRIAQKYAQRKITNEAAYQKKLDQTRAYLNPDVKMLEMACGTGTTALHLAPYVDHIDALDISANMLEIAKQKAKEAEVSNIAFTCCDLESVDLRGKTYDVILAHSILHLVDDRDAVIDKIYALLKPGGIFVSSTACLNDGFWWLKALLPIGFYLGWLPSVRFFSAESLKDRFRQVGFDIEIEWQPSKTQALFIIARKRI